MKICKKCNGTGWHIYDDVHTVVCDACCAHDKGWWTVTEHYTGYKEGQNNLCCLKGCGTMLRDLPQSDDKFIEVSKYQELQKKHHAILNQLALERDKFIDRELELLNKIRQQTEDFKKIAQEILDAYNADPLKISLSKSKDKWPVIAEWLNLHTRLYPLIQKLEVFTK